jgi:polyisoprenoid-binding protein YceI
MATTIAPTTTTWKIDSAHSTVEFAVKHLMISTVKGRLGDIDGTITTEGDDLTSAQAEINIHAASINTNQQQRDAHLRSPDFLDVEKFPEIIFVSKQTESRGHDEFRLIGDLTIRGVTHSVAIEVRKEGEGKDPWGNERIAFSAKTKIDRREFGLVWNQALETGGVVVGDEIRISIDVELIKQD